MSVYILKLHTSLSFSSHIYFSKANIQYILSVRTNYLSRAVCCCIETEATG